MTFAILCSQRAKQGQERTSRKRNTVSRQLDLNQLRIAPQPHPAPAPSCRVLHSGPLSPKSISPQNPVNSHPSDPQRRTCIRAACKLPALYPVHHRPVPHAHPTQLRWLYSRTFTCPPPPGLSKSSRHLPTAVSTASALLSPYLITRTISHRFPPRHLHFISSQHPSAHTPYVETLLP